MRDVSHYAVGETLKDGSKIQIQALAPEHHEALQDAVANISAKSLYTRFFAVKRHFSEKEKSFFLNPDFKFHVALVAIADVAGSPIVAGGGRYVGTEPGQAEMAFAVIDAYQGKGIGKLLMKHLVMIARDCGLVTLTAEVLATNAAMLKVFEKSGLPMTRRRDGQTLHVVMTLNG